MFQLVISDDTGFVYPRQILVVISCGKHFRNSKTCTYKHNSVRGCQQDNQEKKLDAVREGRDNIVDQHLRGAGVKKISGFVLR